MRRSRAGSKSGDLVDSSACSDRKPASAPDAVDQMPLSSRSSVATIPSRRFLASSVAGPASAASTCCAGSALRRSTQVRRVRMSASARAAAWRRGARSAWARSVQCEDSARSLPPAPAPAPTSTRTRAVASDPVHSRHDCSGDQRSGSRSADRPRCCRSGRTGGTFPFVTVHRSSRRVRRAWSTSRSPHPAMRSRWG